MFVCHVPPSGLATNVKNALAPTELMKYLFGGRGRLSSPGLEANAAFRTGLTPEFKGPDAQVLNRWRRFHVLSRGLLRQIILLAASAPGKIAHRNVGVRKDMIPEDQNGFGLINVLLHPKSSGSITLATNNPLDPPKIDVRCPYHSVCIPVVMVTVMGCDRLVTWRILEILKCYWRVVKHRWPSHPHQHCPPPQVASSPKNLLLSKRCDGVLL